MDRLTDRPKALTDELMNPRLFEADESYQDARRS